MVNFVASLMKQIGLLGGMSWPSTIEYYRLLNKLVAERLGEYHSANLLLKSIDYHQIKSNYHDGWDKIPQLLKVEIETFLLCKPDCLILCNNTLHKAYDKISGDLNLSIPFFHAVDLTADYAKRQGQRNVLLLATKFTMEDEFFYNKLEAKGLNVTIPNKDERQEIQSIQSMLAAGETKPEYIEYFKKLIDKYSQNDAVMLACTELPLAVTSANSCLPIINPTLLQCKAAVDFALGDYVS